MSERWQRLWYWPAPALRLSSFRLLVGAFALGYLAYRFPGFTNVGRLEARQFEPVGAARLLSTPLPPYLVTGLVLLALLLAAGFTLGFRYRVVGPAFALLLLWVTSYRSSWGMLFHTDNLLVLHVLVLALAPAADRLSWDARSGRAPPRDDAPHGRYGWALRAVCVITVLTYFVAGVAKLKLGGWAWLDGEQLRAQIAYDNLRKLELGRPASELGVWFVRQPALFPPLAVATLLIELGAPLALLHRRVALAWALLAFGFHVGVALLMNIKFPYPLSLVPYLAFFRLERWPSTKLGARVAALLSAALCLGCGPPALSTAEWPRSAPDPNGPIVVLGDTQRTSWAEASFARREQNEAPRRELVRLLVEQERPALLVHLGDMVVSGASAREWSYFDELMAPLVEGGVRIRPVLGNHEYWGNDRAAMAQVVRRFPELRHGFYAEVRRGVGLVWLDTNLSGRRAEAQARWFARTLDVLDRRADVRGVLVFTHHPPHAIGRKPDPLVAKRVLPPFLRARKTLALLSGHVHGYERFTRSGKTLIVSGGGGGPRVDYPSRGKHPFHYLTIAIEPRSLLVTVKCLRDAKCPTGVLDRFALPW